MLLEQTFRVDAPATLDSQDLCQPLHPALSIPVLARKTHANALGELLLQDHHALRMMQ
jgi:hypothetical protein